MVIRSLVLTLLLVTGSLSAFEEGEALHYSLSWTGLKAGEMTLRTTNLGDTLLIEQHTKSTGLVRALFRMDNTYISYVEPEEFS